MSTTTTVTIIVIALIVVAAAALTPRLRARGARGRLQRRFGPEFDRVNDESGDPKAAIQQLSEREREHDALTLRPLDPAERERYVRTWAGIQEQFVDDPRASVRQADRVITDLLTEIGYPAQDHDRQLTLAAVEHSEGLAEYREARGLLERDTAVAAEGGDATETLRQAMRHYRIFFEDLLGERQSASPAR